MNFISKFERYLTVIYVFTIITIVATSYFTFKEFFISHSQRQQEAIIPLFSVITSEIIRPLTIAQYMANDQFLIEHAQQSEIDKPFLSAYLTKISKQFNMLSFLALEKHHFMIDSTNKQTQLDDSNPEWFYRLKASNKKQLVDIGNAEDPHLYFDLRLENENKEFIGFVGVGIDLTAFSEMFTKFHQQFGFELYFVDENNIITLASNNLMKAEKRHRLIDSINVNDLDWYKSYLAKHPENNQNKIENKNTNFSESINELIISRMPLKALNWQLYIVAPPATEQSDYWQLFIRKLVIFLLVFAVLFVVFYFAVTYFKSKLVKDSETDYLTQLPNRSYIHWQYKELNKQHHRMSVVIADIDKFKEINDTYGHLVGDDVLKVIAKRFTESLRKFDITGRWGGEEFIMLLPDASADQAQEIIDRIRINIANIPFLSSSTSKEFNVTVSFGISECPKSTPLEKVLEKADKALYIAKANGRNQVVVHLD